MDRLEGIDDSLEVVERALPLTVLLEPALLALRRLALENEPARRLLTGHPAPATHPCPPPGARPPASAEAPGTRTARARTRDRTTPAPAAGPG
ncbi:hypothetical protein [Streptomyces sp. NPDC003480]